MNRILESLWETNLKFLGCELSPLLLRGLFGPFGL